MLKTMVQWIDDLLRNPRFLTGLFVVNVIGSIYGYYWYWGQLSSTPKYFWIFVPDSPLSTTLFAIVLLSVFLGRKLRLLPFLASAFLIKYGFWAVLINLQLLWIGESFTLMNLMLALSHLGMALEGIIYYPGQRIAFGEAASLTVILLFQDFMDYGLGLHPYLFNTAQYVFAQNGALMLTGLLIGFIWYHYFFPITKKSFFYLNIKKRNFD
ncbi:DUF1405 domain-containing protein [Dehalobacterium formicoaceticum]|uniref:DUF1405 domain-containing protein n=1 Tax=Dehalobacterium formicoaceticum TaxID=51515 RepID=A0ABT1Y2R8_9FIRM|nr:DUF1405 domain-containing protein [Dehalobacterium formicoaceticum]MCR6545165.1 DUF1405 domain-containing protein [Dehalobacterium formicoaceticum]